MRTEFFDHRDRGNVYHITSIVSISMAFVGWILVTRSRQERGWKTFFTELENVWERTPCLSLQSNTNKLKLLERCTWTCVLERENKMRGRDWERERERERERESRWTLRECEGEGWRETYTCVTKRERKCIWVVYAKKNVYGCVSERYVGKWRSVTSWATFWRL